MKNALPSEQHSDEAQISTAELSEDDLNKVTGGGGKTPAPKPVKGDELPTESIAFNYGKIEW
jgi:bacteriocin-like protein